MIPSSNTSDFFPAWREEIRKARLIQMLMAFVIFFSIFIGVALRVNPELIMLPGIIILLIIALKFGARKVELALSAEGILEKDGTGNIRTIRIEEISEFGVIVAWMNRRWIRIGLRDGSPVFRYTPREKGIVKPSYSQFAFELSEQVRSRNSALISTPSETVDKAQKTVSVGLSPGERLGNFILTVLYSLGFLLGLGGVINYLLHPYDVGSAGAFVMCFMLIFGGWLLWRRIVKRAYRRKTN